MFKNSSFNTKVTLSFALLSILLLGFLFIQIIPNIQDKQREHRKQQIEHMIILTQQQLKLAIKFFEHSSNFRKQNIENQLSKLVNKYNQEDLTTLAKKSTCEVYLLSDRKIIQETRKSNYLHKNINTLKKEKLSIYQDEVNHMCPKRTLSVFYTHTLDNKRELVLECNPKNLKNAHENLEKKVKEDLEKSFKLTQKGHKGKINLIWINTKTIDYEKKPLYNKTDNPYNPKYCISKMSSSDIPQVGRLSAKQLYDATKQDEPIIHIIDNKKAYTWVSLLQSTKNIKLIFLTTVYEEDLEENVNTALYQIIPAAFFSLLAASILGFLLFKRLFKTINLLTHTAKEVDLGNLQLRNNIEGKDDISLLAKTFDKMLDSIEQSFKELDKKVEDKTIQLQHSLNEKEVLLKEIHHRVKNNLAMTINLIKLQKSKIKDEKTKEILIDIQERIFTMELLHQKLYESKDLSSINFKSYVTQLSDDLQNTYAQSKNIRILHHIDEINMNIEYALPCGLIITEAITNACKYAFKNNKGVISIIFKVESNRATLIISDDGVGLPESIDIHKTKSLGLRLISLITKDQLLGSFNYVYKDGAKFYIIFNIK